MADPTDIEFKLTTTGDPSGAEEVEKSIFAAEDAAKQASRQADVDMVKAKQAAEVQREQAALLGEIAEGQQRIVALDLAKTLGQVAAQFGNLSPEVQMAVNAGQNFLQVFASTGDPIKALLALTATAIGGVVTAYRDAAEQTKQLAKAEGEHLKRMAELRRDFAAQVRAENLTTFFQSELNIFAKQVTALETMARLKGAQRGADAAIQDAFGPSQSREQGINADLARQIAEIDAGVKLANDKAAIALTAANVAKSTAAMAQAPGSDADTAVQLLAEAEKAAGAAEAAQAAAEAIAATAVIEKQQLAALAASEFRKLTDETSQTFTDQATAARDAMQQAADAAGAAFPQDAKSALGKLTKLLEDGVQDIKQVDLIAGAMEQFRVSQLGANQGIADNMKAMLDNVRSLVTILSTQSGQIEEQRRQIEQLGGQVQGIQSRSVR